jgi:phosphoglycolate phosphatase
MNKCILFDFDGTMADSRTLAVELYNDLAEKYRYEKIKEHDIEALSKLSIKERLKVLGVPFYKLPSLVMEMKRNYSGSIDSLHVVEGLPSLISDLKSAGHRLYILSTNSRPIIERFLSNHQITGFDHTYCERSLFGKSKKIDQFIKKHRIKQQDAVYIGDELRDIIACKQSGIQMIAVSWGYDSPELLSEGNPDFLVSHPEEIMSLVDRGDYK